MGDQTTTPPTNKDLLVGEIKFIAEQSKKKGTLLTATLVKVRKQNAKWLEELNDSLADGELSSIVCGVYGVTPGDKCDGAYRVEILSHRASTIKSETWQWVVKGYLPKGAEVHLFASKGRGKTKVCTHFNKLTNDQGMRVIRFNMEDHEASILKPGLYAAGCNLELTEVVDRSALASKDGTQMPTLIDFSQPEFVAALKELVTKFGDVGLVIIEPINNYKGKSKAISEDDMRPIHTALATLAEELKICILTVSHTNRKKDVDIQEKAHGAGSGINVARVNLYLDKDPDGDADERILADAGSNIKVGKSIVFKIVEQPPFELDGVTHKEIAIALFDRETDTTAQDLVEQGESPARQSQARDIGVWLVEYLTGKGEIRKDVVLGAGKQFNKDWSEDNITKVFNRRMKKISRSRTEGGQSVSKQNLRFLRYLRRRTSASNISSFKSSVSSIMLLSPFPHRTRWCFVFPSCRDSKK